MWLTMPFVLCLCRFISNQNRLFDITDSSLRYYINLRNL